jgi:hypothetical protein
MGAGWFTDSLMRPRPGVSRVGANISAMELLLQAYRDEIEWLKTRAREYESNQAVAADYIHRANNLQSIIDGYERLCAAGRST